MTSTTKLAALALSSTALVALTPPIYAQSSQDDGLVLDPITTTAQKRPESLQDVPISVSAVSGAKLEEAGLQDLEDAVTYTPNVVVNQQAIGYNINIRGIQSGNQAGFEQSVGTFVDGVYRGRGVQSRFSFLDVEALEVLRGPQGTLFGKNVVAGALNIRSAKPTDDLSGAINVSYNPEFEETQIKGHISGPVSDTVRGRFAFLDRKMEDGWILNETYGEGQPQTDERAYRGTLEWDASPNTLVSLKAEYGEWDNAGRPFEHIQAGPLALLGVEDTLDGRTQHGSVQAGSPLNVGFGLPTDSVQEVGSSVAFEGDTTEYVGTLEHDFEAGKFTALASYSEYEFQRLLDADYNPADVANFHEWESFDQTSLELRFESDQSKRFDYIVGAYYNQNTLASEGLSIFSLTTIGALLGTSCQLGGGTTVPFNPLTDDSTVTLTNAVAANYGVTTAAIANDCAQASLINPIVASGLLANAEGVSGVNRYARLDQDTETYALFGQATYDLTDRLRVTGGLRYTSETKDGRHVSQAADYARTPMPTDLTTLEGQLTAALAGLAGEFVPFDTGTQSRTEENLTWSVNSQYDLTDNTMVYASASTGFKSGGYNTFYFSTTPTSDGAEFDDEEVLSFEIGSKMSFAGGRGELNTAIFRTEYDNLQVSIFSGNTTFEVQNAAKALTQGIEIDGRFQATENLQISGSLGLIDFEFEEFPNQACTNDQFVNFRETIWNDPNNAFSAITPALAALLINNGTCAQAGVNDLQGQTSSQTPEVSSVLSFAYDKEFGDLGLTGVLDFVYRGEVFRQDDLDPLMLDDEALYVNASIRLAMLNNGLEIGLVGKNLTDVEAFDFGNDVPLASGSQFVGVSPPRSFEIVLGYKF